MLHCMSAAKLKKHKTGLQIQSKANIFSYKTLKWFSSSLWSNLKPLICFFLCVPLFSPQHLSHPFIHIQVQTVCGVSFFLLAEKLKLKLLISLSVYVPSLQLPPSAIPQPWNIVRILCHCTRCFTEELPPSLSPSFPLSPVSFPFLSPPSLTSTPKHHLVFSFSFYLLLSLCPSICSSTPAGGTAFVSHLGLGVSMYVCV